jgi:hypothetical protein
MSGWIRGEGATVRRGGGGVAVKFCSLSEHHLIEVIVFARPVPLSAIVADV